MVNKKSTPKPTSAELILLQYLWESGPSTVRQIHEGTSGETGYTTTLKILQKMATKGLVNRDESERTHVYMPAEKAERTQRTLVEDLLKSAFGGKPGKLVIQALSDTRATDEELSEIRELLDSIESSANSRSETVKKRASKSTGQRKGRNK